MVGAGHFVRFASADDLAHFKRLGVELPRRPMLGNRAVHQGLGERGLIALVMAVAAIAEHVDHDIHVEYLTELRGDPRGLDHRLGIVAVDMENRRLHRLGDIGRIGRGARVDRARGEADLVVDDDVDRPAGPIAAQTREAEALGDQALSGESGVAVHQDRHHFDAIAVAALALLGPHLSDDDRVDRLEVRGIGGQREMNRVSLEVAISRGAEMVLYVA